MDLNPFKGHLVLKVGCSVAYALLLGLWAPTSTTTHGQKVYTCFPGSLTSLVLSCWPTHVPPRGAPHSSQNCPTGWNVPKYDGHRPAQKPLQVYISTWDLIPRQLGTWNPLGVIFFAVVPVGGGCLNAWVGDFRTDRQGRAVSTSGPAEFLLAMICILL